MSIFQFPRFVKLSVEYVKHSTIGDIFKELILDALSLLL